MRIHLFGVKCQNTHFTYRKGPIIFVADVDLETRRQLSFHWEQDLQIVQLFQMQYLL